MKAPPPFEILKANHYGALLVDPPWSWKSWGNYRGARAGLAPAGNRATENHYETIDAVDIHGLPVESLALRDCVLFLWATWPLLPEAMAAISAWGFNYKTCAFSWTKANATQVELFNEDIKADMLLGYWTRANTEPCLLATRGKPKRLSAAVRQAIIEPRRQHSRKPDCVHGRIERLVAGPYLELFGRAPRKNWDVWGNESSKFPAAAE